MSNGGVPVYDPNQPSPGSGGCSAAILIFLGVVMLLPGVCFMAFGSAGDSNLAGTGFLILFMAGVLIVIGVGMYTSRRRSSQPPKAHDPADRAAENTDPDTSEPLGGPQTSGISRETLLAVLLLAGVILLVLWFLRGG